MFKTKETALRNIDKYDFSRSEFDLFRDDKDVVLAAVEQSPRAFGLASERLRDDNEVVAKAIDKNIRNFSLASLRIRENKELFLSLIPKFDVVLGHENMLSYASGELKDDEDVVLAAVAKIGNSFQYASERLRSDKDFVLKITAMYGRVFDCAHFSLKQDVDFISSAIETSRFFFTYASDEIKNNKEIVMKAVNKDPKSFSSASTRLRRDKDVLNSIRGFLVNEMWVKGSNDTDVFVKAKEKLIQYDECDRVKRAIELQSRLADLEKLQAQQNSNQTKTQVRTKRKL